ncbi:MAG: hypothetical protein AABZ60_00985 [Planctomycetota bacterium]
MNKTYSLFRLLLKQRLLLMQRRYWNYLNLFFLLLFCTVLYYESTLLFASTVSPLTETVPQRLSWIFNLGWILLPLLQLPRVIQLLFTDRENTFLLTHPLSLKHYFLLRWGERWVSQGIWILLLLSILGRAYHLTQDRQLFQRSLLLLGLFWFSLPSLEIVLAFLIRRFFSWKIGIVGFGILWILLGYPYSWNWELFFNAFISFSLSPFFWTQSYLWEGNIFAFLGLLSSLILLPFFGYCLCSHFQWDLLSSALEVDRSQRRLFFHFFYLLFGWLPLAVRALFFRDVVVLVRKGFFRGLLMLLILPILAFFLVSWLPTKPQHSLNELSIFFLQVVLFTLGSFTLSIDYGMVLKDYRVWERSSSSGALEQFLATSFLCTGVNGVIALLVVSVGHFSKIYTGIPFYEWIYLKSLLLAAAIGFFAGGFNLSAQTGEAGGDANTYAMSAAFLGIILAILLVLKPVWITLYPLYIWSLYRSGKTRFERLEVL